MELLEVMGAAALFQSTPPARRATLGGGGIPAGLASFNPRPPRGGRHVLFVFLGARRLVSIHAPRAEGDGRPPERSPEGVVSIHAPRAEGDSLRPL